MVLHTPIGVKSKPRPLAVWAESEAGSGTTIFFKVPAETGTKDKRGIEDNDT